MHDAVGYQDDFYDDEFERDRGFVGRMLAAIARRPLVTAATTVVVVASVVIIANAVFFQSAEHPSPFFDTRDEAPSEATPAEVADNRSPAERAPGDDEIGRLVEVAAADAPRLEGAGASVSVIRVQQLLDELGYDPGTIDGLFGSRTSSAIEAFERDQGMTVTGEVSETLLARLEEAAPGAAATAGAPVDLDSETAILAVQSALNRAGYGPVPIDGDLSDDTRSAIRSFQLGYGLDVTGRIDQALVDRMTAIGALEPF